MEDTIAIVANKVIKQQMKLSDVPETRRRRLNKFIKTVPITTIEAMATRDERLKTLKSPQMNRTKDRFHRVSAWMK